MWPYKGTEFKDTGGGFPERWKRVSSGDKISLEYEPGLTEEKK